jgi:hypothetical protein
LDCIRSSDAYLGIKGRSKLRTKQAICARIHMNLEDDEETEDEEGEHEDLDKMTVSQLKRTRLYHKLPRNIGKSKLTRYKLLEVLQKSLGT